LLREVKELIIKFIWKNISKEIEKEQIAPPDGKAHYKAVTVKMSFHS
jgi:hypothetical protein